MRHQAAPVERIHFHGNIIFHFHNRHLVSFMEKGTCGFRAYQASAHDRNTFSKSFRVQFRLNGHNYIFSVNSRNGRPKFRRANRDNQSIRFKIPDIFRCCLCIHDNRNPRLFYAADQNPAQLSDIFFKIRRPCRVEISPKLI